MSPTQITPLVEAAYHLKNIKDSQRHAFTVAATLVDRLPFTAMSFEIASIQHGARFEWGVRLHVHQIEVPLFADVAAELGGEVTTDIHSTEPGRVASYRRLSGALAGVPFEIRAYMGSQQVTAVAA